jgi:hypothetical protein
VDGLGLLALVAVVRAKKNGCVVTGYESFTRKRAASNTQHSLSRRGPDGPTAREFVLREMSGTAEN